jgi:hypothetical protein
MAKSMKITITIAEFRARVQNDYGTDIAAAVDQRLSQGQQDIEFAAAMNLLDDCLLAGMKPLAPKLGRTTSGSGGEFQFPPHLR